MEFIVICPGNRSTPLAMAAGGIAEDGGLKLITAIDERSAGFLALGISSALGKAAVVVTTSGTAVANLLPAAVEADRSCLPVIFLTADRPHRLKNCGSNQTVNQEDFLKSVCRFVEEPSKEGFHLCSDEYIKDLGLKLWKQAHECAGPIHCNIAFEEPLHASLEEQKVAWIDRKSKRKANKKESLEFKDLLDEEDIKLSIPKLDPFKPGIIVAGPWRGLSKDLKGFKIALNKWQKLTGWPVFADSLSGLDINQTGLVFHWDLLISAGFSIPNGGLNVLRLGPLPSSRTLEKFLSNLNGSQVLITEGDERYLDPLKLSEQWSYGLLSWWRNLFGSIEVPLINQEENNLSKKFLDQLLYADSLADFWLNQKLPLNGQITEPSLARWIPKLTPLNFDFMLAASSPIRDWIVYGAEGPFYRRCFSFRGASGIDGTLSLAMGLSIANGPLVLITGDLALLHDTNGWLFAQSTKPPLVVLLIDNGGGGIFDQLDIEEIVRGEFENLFKMPQAIDPLALASAYSVPFRQISCLEDLAEALEWGISLNQPVLLRVCTSSSNDHKFRKELKIGFEKHLSNSIKKDS